MAEDNATTTAASSEAKTRTRRGRKPNAATTGRRATTRTTTTRHSYRAEVEQLRAENERLKRRIMALESAPGSSMESSLILKASESSFRAGVETGLMLQGGK